VYQAIVVPHTIDQWSGFYGRLTVNYAL